jgi:hypothetical protein
VNQLAQQASIYIVSQGFFWVASVSLVEAQVCIEEQRKAHTRGFIPATG